MRDFYDRPLIGYLPEVIKKIREYQALMYGEQPEIFDLFIGIDTALNNQFIITATEYGVERWEKILGIVPKATFTLDERKFTILAKLSEQLPFTYRMLEQMMTQLCGEDGFRITLQNEIYTLNVSVDLTAANNFNDVDALLKRTCPANLIINLTLEYNQHQTLKPFTHAQLQAWTHYQLRNEVLS
jgi:hypothetical protein